MSSRTSPLLPPKLVLIGLALSGLILPLAACSEPEPDAGDASANVDAGSIDAGSSADASSGVDAGPPPDAGPACVGCGLCAGDGAPSSFEQTLLDLPPRTWFEAPDSHMRSVCVDDALGVRGVVGCPAIVSAWSGGAYDRGRHRMVIWGGGHDDYWGNELYGFDTRTGSWSRMTEPSTVPDGATAADFFNRDPLPDGQPNSRHTYDGVEYIDHLDVILGHGGSRARDGNGTARTWYFDADTGWSMHADGPGGFSTASAYDPTSRQLLVMASEALHIYDIDADSWSAAPGFGFPPLWPRYALSGDKTGVVDRSRQLFWAVGARQIIVWDIEAETVVTDDWVTTGGGDYTNVAWTEGREGQLFESGGGDVYNATGPGFDYDAATDSLVAWPNEGAPQALDLTTRTWSSGEASGAPTSANSGGTLGRWRYIEAYNVFILVNSVDENVYFYKHSAGCGPSAP